MRDRLGSLGVGCDGSRLVGRISKEELYYSEESVPSLVHELLRNFGYRIFQDPWTSYMVPIECSV